MLRSRTGQRRTGQLRSLTSIEADRPLVVSCYLDTDGRARPRYRDLVAAAEQVSRSVRGSAERLGLDRDSRAEVDSGLAVFLRSVDELVERGATRGLAVFSCRSLGLEEELRLPVRVPDRGAVGRRPCLLPLALATAGRAPIGLILTERERARLAIYRLGELEELPGLRADVPAQTSGGGWAQARLARHSDEAAHHHVKRVAEAAYQAFRDVEDLEVVLAGPEAAVNDLAGCLRADLARRVVGRLHLPVAVPTAELTAALAEVEAARAAEQRVRLVDRLHAEAGSATVAAGLEPFLEALRERRVVTVLVADGASAPGARCPSCGTLALALDCPACGSPTAPLEDVVEPALEEALRYGATVMQVPQGAGLDVADGVGALLRY